MDNEKQVLQSKVSLIEELVGVDPGKRGIGPLAEESRAQASLFQAAKELQTLPLGGAVGITTGFYIIDCKAPETDGPLGALAIAKALVKLGHEVCIITDKYSEEMMRRGIEATTWPIPIPNRTTDEEKEKSSSPKIPSLFIFPFRPNDPSAVEPSLTTTTEEWDNYCQRLIEQFQLRHLISIERVGASQAGTYHNMRGMDITQYSAPIDRLFSYALRAGIHTTGIGDGGNEIGMGKLRQLVETHIPLGTTIACNTATTNLIVAGVSNWGGYALAGSLYLLAKEDLIQRIKNHEQQLQQEEELKQLEDMLVTKEEISHLLDVILDAGAVDGRTREKVRSVDGLTFEDTF
jgi:hypothetical protein